jgi:hypothetical protein
MEEIVNAAIREGWKPLGGLTVGTKQGLMPYLFQAMLKD